MPKFIIQRNIPNAGSMTAQELQGVARLSCNVLQAMGPEIQWVQSYVTADRIYCVYNASNKDLIDGHARESGFPANMVSEVVTIIDPTTADG